MLLEYYNPRWMEENTSRREITDWLEAVHSALYETDSSSVSISTGFKSYYFSHGEREFYYDVIEQIRGWDELPEYDRVRDRLPLSGEQLVRLCSMAARVARIVQQRIERMDA